MEDSINKKIKSKSLPSIFQSREGWSKVLEMKRSPQPHLHQIEPTNACPYDCMMCPRSQKMTRKVGFMEMDVFTKVIDEVKGYSPELLQKEVELFHFGESLLHPQIVAMTDYASSAGLNTVLSVNAPELTPEKAEALLKCGTGRIIISLDGYDADSYKKLRGNHADYNKAVENISQAIQIHKRLKSTTKISVRMILIKENMAHAEEFRSQWEGAGIDVEIREFFPWGEKELVKLGTFEKYPPFMPCPFTWQYVVVQWNGDVVSCCRDYNAVNVMGNVKENSLVEIWNGPIYEQFRKDMAAGTYRNSICPPCMDIYYNEDVD